MWKNPKGDYRRAPSRTPSRRPYDRRSARSFSKPRGALSGMTPSATRTGSPKDGGLMDKVKKLKENVTKILNNQKESMLKMDEMVKKTKTVGWVEEDIEEKEIEVKINGVMFMKEIKEFQAMVVDTGCPKSLVGIQWLKKYLKMRNITKDQLKTKTCSQKFRFGPSGVYEAKEIMEIPITVKINDKEESFVKIKVNAYVVEAENVPLLCGRNTMNEWGAILDMKTKVMKITDDEIMEIKCLSTDGGHLVVKIQENECLEEEEVVLLLKEEKESHSVEKIKRIHESL
jgi:hypothetical protein